MASARPVSTHASLRWVKLSGLEVTLCVDSPTVAPGCCMTSSRVNSFQGTLPPPKTTRSSILAWKTHGQRSLAGYSQTRLSDRAHARSPRGPRPPCRQARDPSPAWQSNWSATYGFLVSTTHVLMNFSLRGQLKEHNYLLLKD